MMGFWARIPWGIESWERRALGGAAREHCMIPARCGGVDDVGSSAAATA
jgi:hypothetical protein